ncbi:hypothetical protein B0I35DRAFT_430558 [Stachybotrys elegans]|uniref:RNA polymerase II assembly factor Rtp1 C-terminal domain-containing protein n=1 Tax=Stachybotrys elegans TaxID=80388 RepID=A0A8K0SUD3_9HYPO|nr:hypothetical protein B0I35DRAFT_430558 [Stachybotrys elegans]
MSDPKPPVQSSAEPKLIDAIVECGKKAFDPKLGADAREDGLRKYTELVERSETWYLLLSLNALIKPNILPSWLKDGLMNTLTRLPLRRDGVRGTMEFVFSVHPSSHTSAAGATGPQKEGASITHEAVAVAAKLLSSVPTSMVADEWFRGISDQLFSLLDGDSGKDLAKPAAQIIGFGILGKKQYGAPGSAGWNAFVLPLTQNINPSLGQHNTTDLVKNEPDEVLDLSRDAVLVPSASLKKSLERLKTLILSTPSPGLCRRVLRPILPQLWAIASWPSPSERTEEEFVQPARLLLQTYLQLFGSPDSIQLIINNLLCNGSNNGGERPWVYRLTTDGCIEIVLQWGLRNESPGANLEWGDIDGKAGLLADIMATACSKEDISSIFLHLLERWIHSANTQRRNDVILNVDEQKTQASHEEDLITLVLLQKLMDKAPEKLISHFDQLMDLICKMLKADRNSSLGDDVVSVLLSLLNLVVTAPTFRKADIKPENLLIVEESLEALGREDRPDVSPTARNLRMLLKYRDELEQPDEDDRGSTPSARQIEDRRTYNLAMNYITSGDSPPPVISEGLNLLSGLILSESSILDITAVNVLMSNLLSNGEDYINLRVIKVFTQLAGKHPRTTMQELLDHYLDAQEKVSTDVRLRFGEALLQVIERLGDTFTGQIAQQASETLLSIAGRRGYRPKTMAKAEREERMRKLKEGRNKGDMIPEEDEDDAEDELTEEDKANNDIIAQIIQGWESKRGAEDVRMRASALSIFGTALEVNIAGIGPTLVSAAVDLCINVLAMEPELEKGILRRSAILVILGFVKALEKAKETGRSLGFGLTDGSREDIQRTLQYIAATDNDGLVRGHAAAVIESLENWQMSSWLPRAESESATGLTRLAGLHVNPGAIMDASGRPRPRIEEIE